MITDYCNNHVYCYTCILVLVLVLKRQGIKRNHRSQFIPFDVPALLVALTVQSGREAPAT